MMLARPTTSQKLIRIFAAICIASLLSTTWGQEAPDAAPLQTPLSAFPSLSGLSDLIPNPMEATAAPVKTSCRVLVAPDGQTGIVQIATDIAEGWKIYSISQPAGGPTKTTIVINKSPQFALTGPFIPDNLPHIDPPDEYFTVNSESHATRVVWTAPIKLTAGVDAQAIEVRGHLNGQACRDACQLFGKKETQFVGNYAGVIAPSDVPSPQAPPSGDQLAATNGAGTSANNAPTAAAQPSSTTQATAVGSVFGFETIQKFGLALLAGLVLNLMPCVLPVIGLKVMSFVQQAGESPGRILWLNVCYVAGIVAVFMGLASMAAFFGWAWGQQFQKPEFGIVLVSIVFVFALSSLGVWEIPIPGFAGSGAAADLSEKEGPAGAFFKGILTTLLATPCSGPLLVPTLAWAAKQPKPVVFGTFFFMGIGMGLPYLLFGLSPKLMKTILPKPGAWMDTFKQVMGFVLLATVVWIFSFLDKDYFVPTLALLFSLWFACWYIGRIPITADSMQKFKGYAVALLLAVSLGYFSFWALGKTDGNKKWETFSAERLAELQNEGRPVFIQFTADWCLTCKSNEKTGLKPERSQKFLAEHGVTPLVADLTKENLEANALLDELGNPAHGIPFYAVYPGDGRPPFVFNDTPLLSAKFIERVKSALGATSASNEEQRNGQTALVR